jgi:2-hydroxychromene-2-carboxylate isomerase
MTDKPAFEFWFDFASSYSFLTAQRIVPTAADAGVPISWKPFMFGIILRECGWESNPVANNPRKEANMWRDIARKAAQRGHGFTKPSSFPRHPVLADRVALIAANEGWAEQFVPRAFAANFADDRDIADQGVVGELIAACDRDPQDVLARAQSEENKNALKANTQEASAKGLFGAPAFVVGEELFWGDDRLEDALAWWRQPWL